MKVIRRLKKEVSQKRSTNTAKDHYRTQELSLLVCMAHASYLCTKVIEMTTKYCIYSYYETESYNVSFEHYLEQRQWTVKGTVICFGISLSYQWRKGRVLLSSGECQQLDNGRHHTARQTVKQVQDFKLEVLTHTPYSPDFTPSDFYVFCAPKYSTWTSFRIGWGSKASGAWLTGTVNKRLLFPRNVYLSGTLVGVLSSWWELHCRFVSPYCICFCSKSLYIIFPVCVLKTLVHAQSIVITGGLPRLG
jgi:hypothetical protein